MGNMHSCKTDIAPFFAQPMPKKREKPFVVRLQTNDIFDDGKPIELDLIFSSHWRRYQRLFGYVLQSRLA